MVINISSYKIAMHCTGTFLLLQPAPVLLAHLLKLGFIRLFKGLGWPLDSLSLGTGGCLSSNLF